MAEFFMNFFLQFPQENLHIHHKYSVGKNNNHCAIDSLSKRKKSYSLFKNSKTSKLNKTCFSFPILLEIVSCNHLLGRQAKYYPLVGWVARTAGEGRLVQYKIVSFFTHWPTHGSILNPLSMAFASAWLKCSKNFEYCTLYC